MLKQSLCPVPSWDQPQPTSFRATSRRDGGLFLVKSWSSPTTHRLDEAVVECLSWIVTPTGELAAAFAGEVLS